MTLKISSLLTFSALTVATIFIATSCKKSNSGGGGNSVSATISGSGWQTTIPTQAVYAVNGGIGEFAIVGGQIKSGDTTVLTVAFTTPILVHAAVSSDTADVEVEYINAKTLIEYDGGPLVGHSILTVSSWDSVNHKIVGTFTGVLYNVTGGTDSLIVTNGSFNTAYTTQ